MPGQAEKPYGSLSPNGNCLGVALVDALRLVGAHSNLDALSSARSVSDAVIVLSDIRRPTLLERTGSSLLERLALKLLAWRLGTNLAPSSSCRPGDVVLCLRSMSQLYGIPRHDGHWVTVSFQLSMSVIVYDQLLSELTPSFSDMAPVDGQTIISQTGPTLRL